MDDVLDPSLEFRGDEGMAEGSALFCDIMLSYKLSPENYNHCHAWIHSERRAQKRSGFTSKHW